MLLHLGLEDSRQARGSIYQAAHNMFTVHVKIHLCVTSVGSTGLLKGPLHLAALM